MTDYSALDRPSILRYVFYPRKDHSVCPESAFDISVSVDPEVFVSCRFYTGDQSWPWILFFHGNGEVVSDYDDVALHYHRRGLSLVVADYRGYGASNGEPTLTNLVRDSNAIFGEVRKELSARRFRDDLWVMGRSLGSVAALELAFRYPEMIRGMVIESGCSSPARIMRHLGIPVHGVDLEKIDQECFEMIKKISVPALVIHGEQDRLIPLREAEDLFRGLESNEKRLVIIPSADHNNIMAVGYRKYFESLEQFVEERSAKRKKMKDLNNSPMG